MKCTEVFQEIDELVESETKFKKQCYTIKSRLSLLNSQKNVKKENKEVDNESLEIEELDISDFFHNEKKVLQIRFKKLIILINIIRN